MFYSGLVDGATFFPSIVYMQETYAKKFCPKFQLV